MQELLVDFITSLDGYGAAEGWPGWWGLEGPEYLAWLGQQPERDYTILMGANTYRLMSGFATESKASASDEPMTDEGAAIAELARTSKIVFSSALQPPLSWPNTRLISGDAVQAVAAMKQDGTSPMRTLGSLTLCRSFLENDTALTFAEWIASRPEATPGADDLAEQVQVSAAVRGVWCSPVTSDHVLDVCSAFCKQGKRKGMTFVHMSSWTVAALPVS